MQDILKNQIGYDLTKYGIYFDNDHNKYQMMDEIVPNNDVKKAYCEYDGIKILNARYDSYDYNTHQWN